MVSLVLDETGSMVSHQTETVSGFNAYVKELKEKGGNIAFTLTRFNALKTVTPYEGTPIKDVAELKDYRPDSWTPLYDAIGKTITSLDRALQKRTDKPAVLFVVMTDGEENASKEFSGIQIRDLIKTREAAGWDFVYLGADHDAWNQAGGLGFGRANTVSYDKDNTVQVMTRMSGQTMSYVTANAAGASVNRADLGFDDKKKK